MDDRHISRAASKYKLHTCQHCETLVIDWCSLLDPSSSAQTSAHTTLASYSFPGFHVLAAAGQGCKFFRFCVENVKVPAGVENPFRVNLATDDVADKITLKVVFLKKPMDDGVHAKCYYDVSWDRMNAAWGASRFRDLLRWSFPVSVPQGDAAAAHLSGRMIDPSPASAENFSIAQKWLTNCVRSHLRCKASQVSSVPTRLIFVGNGGNPAEVRLVSTQKLGEDISWVALSYCWGGPQPMQTIKDNVNNHFTGIALELLPASIRDAVHVTRELVQQYLWVDSLCIIQDDENDKDQELNKMPDIYNSAVLTIIAATASSCTQGFLYDRAAPLPGVIIRTKISETHGGIAQLVSGGHMHISDEPVEIRGWTYQERILSRRILSYGTFEMTWVCQEHEYSASDRDQTLTSHPPSSSFPTDGSSIEIYNKWQEIVEAYSTRALTFPSDKLVAISAVARYFA